MIEADDCVCFTVQRGGDMQLGATPTPPGFGLRRAIDRIVGDAFSRRSRDRRRTPWVPTMEVREDDDALSVALELPGVSFADVDISAHNGVLTVCERTQPLEGGGAYRHGVPERRDSSFSQSVQLPMEADEQRIGAHFDGDVLIVRVPKRRAPEPRAESNLAKRYRGGHGGGDSRMSASGAA
jgi:HSP20 family protein